MLYETSTITTWRNNRSLNPYSNGICSTSIAIIPIEADPCGLNPYSNGICSTSDEGSEYHFGIHVLILILMEYALRVVINLSLSLKMAVLILILMEYALRGPCLTVMVTLLQQS